MPYGQGLSGGHPPLEDLIRDAGPAPHSSSPAHQLLGQSPVCKGKHCPCSALPRCSPTVGAAVSWAEQTAPGSQSPLFSLKGQLQPVCSCLVGTHIPLY